MAKVKKAQTGAGVPKGMVKGEMTGKLYPKKQMDQWQKSTAKDMTAAKKASPKKKMKDGGKSFPDLTGDGKVTKADILKGRGVLKAGGTVGKSLGTYGRQLGKNYSGKATKTAGMKKCKYGCK